MYRKSGCYSNEVVTTANKCGGVTMLNKARKTIRGSKSPETEKKHHKWVEAKNK